MAAMATSSAPAFCLKPGTTLIAQQQQQQNPQQQGLVLGSLTKPSLALPITSNPPQAGFQLGQPLQQTAGAQTSAPSLSFFAPPVTSTQLGSNQQPQQNLSFTFSASAQQPQAPLSTARQPLGAIGQAPGSGLFSQGIATIQQSTAVQPQQQQLCLGTQQQLSAGTAQTAPQQQQPGGLLFGAQQQPPVSSSGFQFSQGGNSALSFSSTPATVSQSQVTALQQGTALQQAGGGGLNIGSSLFNQNTATGGRLPFGATQPQQGSLFGGNSMLQSQQQQQQTSFNIFAGGAGDKPTAPAQLQFSTTSNPQGSNFFAGGSAATSAASLSSAFSFTAAGSSGQLQQSSLLPAQGSSTPSFQFGAGSSQPAALAQQGTNLFKAQSQQQQAMSGFSFSLGNTEKQQQQQSSFQFSGGQVAATGIGGQTGGFSFSARQNPNGLFGGQHTTGASFNLSGPQQQTASSGGSGGFNFAAAAAQTPSFNFMAGSSGSSSRPATPKSSGRLSARRKPRR